MEQFDALLSKVIDSTLGERCQSFGYSYSEIFRSLMCVFFCGGSCIEDISTHLMHHLSSHPKLKTCSADTIITTILSFDRWDEIFTDKIIAAAMLDRITYQSYIINMTGESYRLKATEKWMKSRKGKIGI